MDNNQNKKPTEPRKGGFLQNWGVYILIIIILAGVFFAYRKLSKPSYTTLLTPEYVEAMSDGRIKTATATPAGSENSDLYIVKGKYYADAADKVKDNTSLYKITITYDQLNAYLNNGASIKLQKVKTSNVLSWVISLLPLALFALFIIFFLRTNKSNNAFDFAKSRARLSRNKNVKFEDVAGCDEEKAELVEVVDFLKNPKKYADMGARIPKGILLFGQPGCGKTLLAKAVAGEANVPFFSISGSDFVEMFVGVGASRVRDLFRQAKENHPCIIFIDEIDAVGRQRGAGMGGGHDEREQTLNQLLVEMDGFNGNMGIIVMAATNRPDVLDPALLRPGRFDRQITINTPDVIGREAILKVHAKNKKLDPEVKLDELAARIPGFSGADIENLLNEAAILAARDNRRTITTEDLDEATDRVMMGPAKKSKKYNEHEKDIVAHHEAGHAVIGLKLEHANIVQKVTIIPRGQAGGYTLMLPEKETFLETKQSLTDSITGLLGGRVAEEIMFNEPSTGASNDFERATKIARAMVTRYGMSNLGPLQYEHSSGSVFLGRDYMQEKNFSDQVALEIDKETRRIVEECYENAKKILTEHKDLMCAIAEYLKKVETLTKADIDEIAATGKLRRSDERDAQKEAEQQAKAEAEQTTTVEAEIVEATDAIENEPQEPEAQPLEDTTTDETR